MINASEERKTNYSSLEKIVNSIEGLFTIGKRICEVYKSLKEKIQSIQAFQHLEIQRSFGHGIGLEFKEKLLEINENNMRLIENKQV